MYGAEFDRSGEYVAVAVKNTVQVFDRNLVYKYKLKDLGHEAVGAVLTPAALQSCLSWPCPFFTFSLRLTIAHVLSLFCSSPPSSLIPGRLVCAVVVRRPVHCQQLGGRHHHRLGGLDAAEHGPLQAPARRMHHFHCLEPPWQ